jgi:hypothetical protein
LWSWKILEYPKIICGLAEPATVGDHGGMDSGVTTREQRRLEKALI